MTVNRGHRRLRVVDRGGVEPPTFRSSDRGECAGQRPTQQLRAPSRATSCPKRHHPLRSRGRPVV